MRLSKNFTFDEFTKTGYSDLQSKNNRYAEGVAITRNLKVLANEYAQPIRDHFGTPMYILSGFRYPDLNERIGGVSNSQHIYGEAMDFYMKGVGLRDIFDWIREESNLIYGQLILEPSWIHLSIPRPYKDTRDTLILREDGVNRYYERV